MNEKINRSPLFYVGDKYRLMRQLLKWFPRKINNFYEPFAGGGTVFLNVHARRYFINDVDRHIVNIHKLLAAGAKNPQGFFAEVEKIILKYKLSHSYKRDIVPESLKKEFKKTYYARFNKASYEKLRACANGAQKNDPLILYVLLIYGFNRMLRFNRNGEFNLPVGNVDFNRNVAAALENYFDFAGRKKIQYAAKDFRKFFEKTVFAEGDFVYLDPPYLLSACEYNKLWGEESEAALLDLIDHLDANRVKFALSNVTHYNGGKNEFLIGRMKKYQVHRIESNYINYHNNAKKEIREVLLTNY
ncbi:MAG: Dam family site-specific DNA-(adenine-N6)-methyltransferase [Gammaproteobacteria bacterium]